MENVVYTKSIYNVFFENYDREGILFNSLSGNMIKISKEKIDAFYSIMKDINNCANQQMLECLKSQGFIVSDQEKEKSIAMKKYNSMVHNKRILNLTIMPTETCNFKCPYCFEGVRNGNMNEDTEKNILEYLKKELTHYGALSINWYGGEPLLRIKTIERLSVQVKNICKSLKIPFVASVTTNGYLLTYDNYRILKKSNVISYSITIDGVPEYHNKTRFLTDGGSTFETIQSNLRTIQEKETSGIISINIRTNYTSENIECKQKWEEYLNQNFLFDDRFRYVPRYAWNSTQSKYDSDKYIPFDFNDNLTVLHEISNTINSLINQKNKEIALNKKGVDFAKKQITSYLNGELICTAGCSNSLVFGADGKIYKCQVLLDSPRNCVGKIVSKGKISYNENNKFWVNDDFATSDDCECINCALFPICFGVGCPAKINLSNKSRQYWCNQLMEEVKKNLHLLTYSNEYLIKQECF